MTEKPCPYGDPLCPCQDGDACHYEWDARTKTRPMDVKPVVASLLATIDALKAELIAALAQAKVQQDALEDFVRSARALLGEQK